MKALNNYQNTGKWDDKDKIYRLQDKNYMKNEILQAISPEASANP